MEDIKDDKDSCKIEHKHSINANAKVRDQRNLLSAQEREFNRFNEDKSKHQKRLDNLLVDEANNKKYFQTLSDATDQLAVRADSLAGYFDQAAITYAGVIQGSLIETSARTILRARLLIGSPSAGSKPKYIGKYTVHVEYE